MRVSKATRKDDLHNSALAAMETWEEAIDTFLTKYGLREPTDDFRLMFLDWGQTKLDVTNNKTQTRNMIRLVQDIRDKDLSPRFKEVLDAFVNLEGVLDKSKIEDEDIGACIDNLRDSFISLSSELSRIRRR